MPASFTRPPFHLDRCSSLALVLVAIAGCQAAGVAPGPSAPGSASSPAGGPSPPGLALPAPDAAAPMAGEGETCAAESVRAERTTVDLLFLVDVSSSMAKTVPGGTLSKLQMARDALVGFMRDPGSAELAGAVQFFPVRATCFPGICVGPVNPPGPTPPCPCPSGLTCMPTPGASPMPCPGNPPSCELGDYRRPTIPFGPLGPAAATTMAAFAAQDPLAGTSGTPTGPALLGAYELLRTRMTANAHHRGVVVVVSDGTPTICEPLAAEALATSIAAARQGVTSIPTYFIGVYSAMDVAQGAGNVVTRLAMAGGTTPFVLDCTFRRT